MTLTTSQTRTPPDKRIFSSPVALAFVRIVTERRGISEAQAKQVYLDYFNRAQPAQKPPASERRVMT